MRSIRFVFPCVTALLVGVLLLIGWFGYRYPLSVMGYPLYLGLFVILMAVFVCATERLEQARPASDVAGDAPKSSAETGHASAGTTLGGLGAWAQLGCLLVLMALAWGLGFVPGIVIFVAGYLCVAGWRWYRAVLYGAAAGLVVWLLFDLVFFTPLPFWPVFMR
jgi:hypothetical protein